MNIDEYKDSVIDSLREALIGVVEGNDLALERGQSLDSWKDSYFRCLALKVLEESNPDAIAKATGQELTDTFILNGIVESHTSTKISYDSICRLAGYSPMSHPSVAYHYIGHSLPYSGILFSGDEIPIYKNLSIMCMIAGNA